MMKARWSGSWVAASGLALLAASGLALLATACSDAPSPPGADAGDPAPRILAFTADPALVARGEPSLLSWTVEDADAIEIAGADGTLVSTFEASGSVGTPALFEDSWWTLIARRGTSVTTSSVPISIDWQPIVVEDVSVDPRSGYIGDGTRLSWNVSNAVHVRVSIGDRVLLDRPMERPADSLPLIIESEEMTLTIELSNPRFSDRREVVVRGVQRPSFTRFSVTHRAWFSRATTATVSWAVEHSRSTELWVDGVALTDFPGTLTGATTIELPAFAASLMLVANSGRDFTVLDVLDVGPPLFESEPNHDLERSNELRGTGAARGEISQADDTDFYSYFPRRGGRFRFTTTSWDGTGCTVDTRLVIADFSGIAQQVVSDGGAPTPGGGVCAAVEVDVGAPLEPAPPIVIVVSGENGRRGAYALIVDDL
jgi:hypothetical protein